MKTVIPEFTEPTIYHDEMDYIFHHEPTVSISRQVRPLAETTYMYTSIGQEDSDRVREMELIVIRFPKHLEPDYSSGLYTALRSAFYHQWLDDGEYVELLLHEGNIIRALRELEKAGVYRLDMKVYADIRQGLYLPHYRYASRFWQRCLNFITITLSVPHGIAMLVKEVYDDRKEKREIKEERA